MNIVANEPPDVKNSAERVSKFRQNKVTRAGAAAGDDIAITISMIEIDYQSHKFAAELNIENISQSEIKLGNIYPRFSSSVALEETVESAKASLIRRHADICRETNVILSRVVASKYRMKNTKYLKYVIEESGIKKSLLKLLNPITLIQLYGGISAVLMAELLNDIKDRVFTVKIESSKDVEFTIKYFDMDESRHPDILRSKYNMKYMKDIEDKLELSEAKDINIIIKPGEVYRSIFVMRGIPNAISPSPSSIAFDIPIEKDGYATRYVEYATITIPPGAFWPSIISMSSAIIGQYIQSIASKMQSGHEIDLYSIKVSTIINYIPVYGVVPALTALIVYNIYEMTDLKERFSSKRGWRTAMLIGFVCGYLNLKVLGALRALIS